MNAVWLPVTALATSLLVTATIFALPEEARRLRTTINLAAAVTKLILVSLMVGRVATGYEDSFSFQVVGNIDFVLRADALGVMFAGLSSLLWLCTTIYAIGYLEGSANRKRFFGFFSLCVASTTGIALADNLFTFLVFYEMLTLSTYPLVVHRGTEQALNAGRVYLRYTLSAGAVLLLGTVLLYTLTGEQSFSSEEGLGDYLTDHRGLLILIYALLVGGLAVKAAMVPLHSWLPRAMVAPAPVSALLHAVAVVKAGAFGILRVIYDLFGIELSIELGVNTALVIAASITIIYGSLRALAQDELKPRLAFSTISQVSYVILGAGLLGPFGTIGALAHLLHQGLMKVTLFFCAGNYAEELGIHRIDDLDGAGRRMPLTSLAFTVGALGMIGLPPVAGFITKWYLGVGAIQAEMYWVVAVLVASSTLNAMYFLPILHRLWFRLGPAHGKGHWPDEQHLGRFETNAWLLWPMVFTALASLGAGLLAGMPFSPLDWATRVANGEYLP
ncbi:MULTISPECIES: complex I subunit 5 family protein [unclassified Halomonas]|uniref:complex I subunit 5 family protein n=1 Tax=unclassified Halomonas TaxID=2609666 RepID=UPI0006DBA3D2|nr:MULTISPECIES: proton-conducting transporter membrane subunit [unclassified Halomonas]KPQ20397.1 MAG: NADH dehydrogenase (quinone) [Halomonas sp. HL-93]SBR50713.1 multicomponent Na+:H+ antiporter subunit D [Halomonas sp. HL-93]SNY96997.1 multicomponent Na+:H+ antiporter subunit D [Halomonas sp. hl-4]